MKTQAKSIIWTTEDLELFPEDNQRYEIIEGELIMTRAPHWRHQNIIDNICLELKLWSRKTSLGNAVTSPGIIFNETSNVIPDLVWISNQRLRELLDESGHLTGAPELVIEVLSSGEIQERRDKQLKLKLYSLQAVEEYWIVDPKKQELQVFRRHNNLLQLSLTLAQEDIITSPLLPNFSCQIKAFFI